MANSFTRKQASILVSNIELEMTTRLRWNGRGFADGYTESPEAGHNAYTQQKLLKIHMHAALSHTRTYPHTHTQSYSSLVVQKSTSERVALPAVPRCQQPGNQTKQETDSFMRRRVAQTKHAENSNTRADDNVNTVQPVWKEGHLVLSDVWVKHVIIVLGTSTTNSQ